MLLTYLATNRAAVFAQLLYWVFYIEVLHVGIALSLRLAYG